MNQWPHDTEAARFSPAPFHQLPDDFRAPAEAFYLRTEDGLRLRLGLWRPEVPARATILLFPGRTEYLEKYAPTAADLTARGFVVLAIDWRGQGLSDRLLPDPRPGHITDFSAYQTDVVEMAVAAQALDLPQPWHLLAHSMGGCIGLAALMNGLQVQSAAFSAPMWGIHTPLPAPLVMGLAGTARRMGRGTRPAIGTGGGGTYLLDNAFRGNSLTSDAGQWARLLTEAARWPDLTLGGATYEWIRAALTECRRLSTLTAPNIPALIGLGALEKVVSPAAIRERAKHWRGAELLVLDGARHELLFEAPPTAQRFTHAVVELFLNGTDG